MTTLSEKTKQFITEVSEAQAAFRARGTTLLKEVTKQFFEENPTIKGMVWEQYTPYFMDGDTCEFSVNDIAFVTTDDHAVLRQFSYGEPRGGDDETGDLEFEFYSSWSGRDISDIVLRDATISFNDFLQSSEMEDVLQDLFGDHVQVIATANGFEVEEYDHD